MEKIVTTDQEQVDKYETDSTSNITDFDNPIYGRRRIPTKQSR